MMLAVLHFAVFGRMLSSDDRWRSNK